MKKITTLVSTLAILALFTTSLHATFTRSAGMSLGSTEEPWAVDGQLPYLIDNPVFLPDFGNVILAETTGTAANSWGAVLFQPLKAVKMGVFVGLASGARHNATTGGIYQDTTKVIEPSLTALGNTLNGAAIDQMAFGITTPVTRSNVGAIVYLDSFGFPLGIGVNYSRGVYKDSYEDSASKITESLKLIESSLRLSVGTKMDIGGMKADFAFTYFSTGINHEYLYTNPNVSNITATNKSTGLGDLILTGRISQKMGKSNMVHLFGQLGKLNSSREAAYDETVSATSDSETHTAKGLQAKVGVSNEIQATKGVLIFVGAAADAQRWTVEGDFPGIVNTTINTTQSLIVPVFFGMEAQLFENWEGRFGVSSNAININPSAKSETTGGGTTTTKTSSKWNDPGSDLNIGLSYDRNNFSFDWNMNIALFTSGPNFVGGGAPGFASMFAASYAFGK